MSSPIRSLLASISEIESRLNEMRHEFSQEIHGLRGRMPYAPPPAPQAIRLQHTSYVAPRHQAPRLPRYQGQRQESQQGYQGQRQGYQGQGQRQRQQQRHRQGSQQGQSFVTVPLSAVVQLQEEIRMRIHLSRTEDAVLVCVFDGEGLTVTVSEHAPSLVGEKVTKPGELVYRFMDELKKSGALKRTFTVAPWRICFVQRDGQEVSLEDLRRQIIA